MASFREPTASRAAPLARASALDTLTEGPESSVIEAIIERLAELRSANALHIHGEVRHGASFEVGDPAFKCRSFLAEGELGRRADDPLAEEHRTELGPVGSEGRSGRDHHDLR